MQSGKKSTDNGAKAIGKNVMIIGNDRKPRQFHTGTIRSWITHSGKASCGTDVHSLQSATVERSTILRDNTGNDQAYATAELEVMATQLFGKIIKKI